MNPSQTLLQAILADPADDLPRLACADWLEGTGDADAQARAEFIRVQVRLAQTACHPPWEHGCSPEKHGAECERLRQRERNLLCHGSRSRLWFDGPWWDDPEWPFAAVGLAPEAAIIHRDSGVRYDLPPRLRYTFQRGFVAKVALALPDFVQHAQALFAHHPIEHVALVDRQPLPLGTGAAGDPWKGWFVWSDPRFLERRVAADGLPPEVLALVPGQRLNEHVGDTYHQGEDDAMRALSVGCVRLGRQRAGLREVG